MLIRQECVEENLVQKGAGCCVEGNRQDDPIARELRTSQEVQQGLAKGQSEKDQSVTLYRVTSVKGENGGLPGHI